MSDRIPTPKPGRSAARVASDGSSYADVSPEIHLAACRRLGWLAIIYASTYFCAEAYGFISNELEHTLGHSWRHHIGSLIPISLASALAWMAWRGRISQRHFGNVVVGVQLLGAIGILWDTWGWETNIGSGLQEIVRIGGADPKVFLGNLEAKHISIVQWNGVPWNAVWVMFVPLLLPLSTTRTIVGSLLGAAVFPVIVGGSLLVHGAPPHVMYFAWGFIMDGTIPSFLCSGMAIVGSRVLYGLTKELSDARQLGSYRLIEQLGTGGMGEVWKAQHRLLARPAAIKLIRAESLGLSDPAAAKTALTRFEREAQATALLGSPHTIEIYDFGATESGSFYYVMELLDGLDLRTLVERHGPIPVERAVFLLKQACHSLADAHASGLIHRDVKPANIFACRRGREYDFVKVLDFGLVKDVGVSDVQLTAEGTTTGTPAFMAPEFVNGPEHVDGRADLYALGCVAFWLVTGKLVFERSTPIQTVLAHINDPPPSIQSRTEYPVPERFERIVMDCLEKDPARRPPSAEALGKRLSTCLDGPAWTDDQARTWWEARGFTGRRPTASVAIASQETRIIMPGS